MPVEKSTKKKISAKEWIPNVAAIESVGFITPAQFETENPVKKNPVKKNPVKKNDSAVAIYKHKLKCKKQIIADFPLTSASQLLFMDQHGFKPCHMNTEQLSICFQWIFCQMGLGNPVDHWRSDIDVNIKMEYLAPIVHAIFFFHERLPEEIVLVDHMNVIVITPGFDTIWSPTTPKNKVYSPSKIKKIATQISEMQDEHRVSLSETLCKTDKIELFKWGEEGAVPYRKNIKTPSFEERRMTW